MSLPLTPNLLGQSVLQGKAPSPSAPAVLRVRRVKSIARGRVRAEVEDDTTAFSMVVFVESDEGEAMPKENDIVDVASSQNVVSNAANGKIAFIVHDWTILDETKTPTTPQTPEASVAKSSSNAMMTTNAMTPSKRSFNSSSPSASGATMTPLATSKARKTLFTSSSSSSSSMTSCSSSSSSTTSCSSKATHKISDLNPYVSKFTVLARALNVSELRERSSSRWSGHIFDVLLEDDSAIIKAVAFGDNAVKMHPLFVNDALVFVTNAQVQSVKDTRYNSTGHNYELVLNARTSVEKYNEKGKGVMRARVYKHITLDDALRKEDKERVDVFALIKSVPREVRQLTARASGRTLRKRELTIVDESLKEGLILTVWDKKADEMDEKHEGKVIYVRGAVINEFNGKSLSVSFSTLMEFVDPEESEQAKKLVEWFKSNVTSLPLDPSSSLSKSNAFINAHTTSLAELRLQMQKNRDASSPSYYEVDVYLTSVNWSSMYYTACPDQSCKRKMLELDNGHYRCNKCNKTVEKCDLRYVLKVTIADCTDHQNVTLFDDEAIILLNNKKAQEIDELRNNDPRAFEALTRKVMFQRLLLKLKCKTEVFNDERRLKISVVSIQGLGDPAVRIEWLEREIDKLKRQLDNPE